MNATTKKILVINPGSTSTKVAVYHDHRQIFFSNIAHAPEELAHYEQLFEQLPFRKQVIEDSLKNQGIKMDFDAIIGRGTLAKPVEGGVYAVDDEMIKATLHAPWTHPCNMACILASELTEKQHNHCQAFMADPGCVDELCDEARISGSPLLQRTCIWHALNQRAVAHRFAKEQQKQYEDLRLIICHMGGGISIAAHEYGKAIDANNALDGEGPFSAERAGTLPAGQLIHLCFSGKYSETQLRKSIVGKAGLTAHLGTNDLRIIEKEALKGNKKMKKILDAMIFHIAKCIAAEGAVLSGNIDALILTGGMACSKYMIEGLKHRLTYLAPIHIYPGEDEMEALAFNALGVLNGDIHLKDY